jgi:hypothetical protein
MAAMDQTRPWLCRRRWLDESGWGSVAGWRIRGGKNSHTTRPCKVDIRAICSTTKSGQIWARNVLKRTNRWGFVRLRVAVGDRLYATRIGTGRICSFAGISCRWLEGDQGFEIELPTRCSFSPVLTIWGKTFTYFIDKEEIKGSQYKEQKEAPKHNPAKPYHSLMNLQIRRWYVHLNMRCATFSGSFLHSSQRP